LSTWLGSSLPIRRLRLRRERRQRRERVPEIRLHDLAHNRRGDRAALPDVFDQHNDDDFGRIRGRIRREPRIGLGGVGLGGAGLARHPDRHPGKSIPRSANRAGDHAAQPLLDRVEIFRLDRQLAYNLRRNDFFRPLILRADAVTNCGL